MLKNGVMIMHKKHSLSHLRLILSDIMIIGFETLRELYKDLDSIESDTKDPLEIARGQRLIAMIVLINNVIHPGFDVSKTMLPGAVKIIDKCESDRNLSIEKKYISPDCACSSCSKKSVK